MAEERSTGSARDLALPGILDNTRRHRSPCSRGETGVAPHRPHLVQCTRPCGGSLPREPSEEKPILTPEPSTPPLGTPHLGHTCRKKTCKFRCHILPNSPGTYLPGHYVDVLLSLHTDTAAQAPVSPAQPLPDLQGGACLGSAS